jgi:ribosomal protein S18 acetylase RimI-like enzyme
MNFELDIPLDRNPAAVCTIRRGVPADANALSAFAARTFSDTYGRYNDPDNLHRHIASAFNPNEQTRELADPDVATLLAHRDDTLAGYAQIRRGEMPECVTQASPIELHRFYIDTAWHGSGLAQRLLDEARATARAFGASALWLKVWERNARAIAFYRKSRFIDVGTADFFVGSDRQTDRVLVHTLPDRT